ncbi:TIM barrel protein [Streptomyces bobili]|uniref:TIM barrel protein n=1 Tax=Streptomyces bobili TaxID=67280 RepID=UPI0036EB8C6C
MYTLAVCAEMVYRDLPIEERARRIHEAGFQVEIWDWTRHDLNALARTGAEFSSMTGYIRGTLTDPDGAAELLRTAEESIKAAEQLGCPRLNLHGTGLDGEGLPVVPVTGEATGEMWITAHRTLTRLAELGESAGVTFTLENLNTAVDHPGVPFARAADTYGEGNLIELIRRAHGAGLIGEIQVADVPGRCEPGTGEINYPAVARALTDLGYDGTVALEAWPSGDSHTAMERFRAALTL